MIVLALAVLCCSPLPQQPPAEQLPLRMLYAGNPGTPYSEAWTGFLAAHTKSVRFVAGHALQKQDLADVDLLVIDGEVESKDPKGQPQLKSEHVSLGLGDLQGFPVVLMGGEGGFFADDHKLKTCWHDG